MKAARSISANAPMCRNGTIAPFVRPPNIGSTEARRGIGATTAR